jgi:hypothetical protein
MTPVSTSVMTGQQGLVFHQFYTMQHLAKRQIKFSLEFSIRSRGYHLSRSAYNNKSTECPTLY